jgi:hypothetical protein
MRLLSDLLHDPHHYRGARAGGSRQDFVCRSLPVSFRFKNDAYQTSARLAKWRLMLRIRRTLRVRTSSSAFELRFFSATKPC